MANDDRFLADRVGELSKSLDANLIKERPGGGKNLKYISGKTAMDTANLIFGFGNWSFRLLSCEQVILKDPLTDEAVGIEYKAMGELTVRGAIGPIVDIGSQPVASWNVFDLVMQRRINAAGKNGVVDESPFTAIEKKQARATIVDAHEQAKKAAATDVLKRLLRLYGDRFGLALYDEESIVEIDGMSVQVKEVIVTKEGNNGVKPSAAARIKAASVRNQIASPKVIDSVPEQAKPADEQPKPVPITKLKSLAELYYPGAFEAVRGALITKFKISGELSDEQIESDYNQEARKLIAPHLPAKQPATASSGK